MSDFFESEIVQEELDEIHKIQQQIYGDLMNFASLGPDDKLEHIEKLETLLEKQRLMYTRLSLSDDPKAIELKEQMKKSVELMGFPANTDVQVLFSGMSKTIANLKQHVDK